MGDCRWTFHGVRRTKMAFSMVSASGWSGTWVCCHGDGSVLRWLVAFCRRDLHCGNAGCLLAPALDSRLCSSESVVSYQHLWWRPCAC